MDVSGMSNTTGIPGDSIQKRNSTIAMDNKQDLTTVADDPANGEVTTGSTGNKGTTISNVKANKNVTMDTVDKGGMTTKQMVKDMTTPKDVSTAIDDTQLKGMTTAIDNEKSDAVTTAIGMSDVKDITTASYDTKSGVTTAIDESDSKDATTAIDNVSQMGVTQGVTVDPKGDTTEVTSIAGSGTGKANVTVIDGSLNKGVTASDDLVTQDDVTKGRIAITEMDLTTGDPIDMTTVDNLDNVTTRLVKLPDDKNLKGSNVTSSPLVEDKSDEYETEMTTQESVTLQDEKTTDTHSRNVTIEVGSRHGDATTESPKQPESTSGATLVPDVDVISGSGKSNVTVGSVDVNSTTASSVADIIPVEVVTVSDVKAPMSQTVRDDITETTTSKETVTSVIPGDGIQGDVTTGSDVDVTTMSTVGVNETTEGSVIIIPGVPIPKPSDKSSTTATTSTDTSSPTTEQIATLTTRPMLPPLIPVVTTPPVRLTSLVYTTPPIRDTTYPQMTSKKSTPVVHVDPTDITTTFIIPTKEPASTSPLPMLTSTEPPMTKETTVPPFSAFPKTEMSTIPEISMSTSPKILMSSTPLTVISTTSLFLTPTNNSTIGAYSKSNVPMAIGITAGILALIAIIVLILYFRKRRADKKRRGAYLDEENVSDYQFDLKQRPNSQHSNSVAYDGYGENSFVEKPSARNHFQEGIKVNNNVEKDKQKDNDDPVQIDVLHGKKSKVPPIPNTNRFSMGPMLLDSVDDPDQSTQHTYDKAYTHGTFKNSSKA